MFLSQDGPAFGAGEYFAFADDARAQVAAAGAETHAASATLRIRPDLPAAVVGHEHGLIRSGSTVCLLAHAAPLARTKPAKRAVRKNSLSRTKVVAAAAPGTLEGTTGIPIELPIGLRI